MNDLLIALAWFVLTMVLVGAVAAIVLVVAFLLEVEVPR